MSDTSLQIVTDESASEPGISLEFHPDEFPDEYDDRAAEVLTAGAAVKSLLEVEDSDDADDLPLADRVIAWFREGLSVGERFVDHPDTAAFRRDFDTVPDDLYADLCTTLVPMAEGLGAEPSIDWRDVALEDDSTDISDYLPSAWGWH